VNLIYQHFTAKFLHLLRQPAFVIATLVFPSLFFAFFAAPNADTTEKANLLLASFAAFAVLGVVLFQFGLDLASERGTAWFQYLRTLPLKPSTFFIARGLAALAYAFLAGAVVMTVAALLVPAHLGFSQLTQLIVALAIGSIPFCLMGLCIGYFIPTSSALPFANLVYLVLSFAGGLWIPPAGLHATVQKISIYLPTRLYGEWAWSAALGGPLPISQILGLAAYALVFAPIAWLGHRRQS
jgi:ABC-2 type transport system permease protein